MCGEKAAKQLDLLPPLKDTVTRRIIDKADDIKSTLIEHVKMSRCFSLQLDESIVDLANLFIYIRYEFEENGIDWIKCVGVCTDGARAMTSRHSGVAARIKEVAPEMNGHIATSTTRPLQSRKCFARLNRLTPLTEMVLFYCCCSCFFSVKCFEKPPLKALYQIKFIIIIFIICVCECVSLTFLINFRLNIQNIK
ncbi:SCND3 protein, partial [Atractosteus spatula]|nr:SCND3 protein [Atractosteus spatula]